MTRAQAEARVHDKARLWDALRGARLEGLATAQAAALARVPLVRARVLLGEMAKEGAVSAEWVGSTVGRRWWCRVEVSR